MKRVIGLPLALLLAIALPACGGGKSKGAAAAGIVPKDAIAFISIALSPSSSQKSDVQDIVSKFPTPQAKKTFDELKDQLLTRAVKDVGLDYQNEVKPWLGSELAVAVLPDTPQPAAAVLIESSDDAKAKAALDKASHNPKFTGAYRIVNGWAVIVDEKPASRNAAILDKVSQEAQSKSDSLADQDKFKRVVDKLTGTRFVFGWADGKAVVDAIKASRAGKRSLAGFDISQFASAGMAAFDLHAESSAVVFKALAETTGGATKTGSAKLTGDLPANSLGELTVFDLGGLVQRGLSAFLRASPQASQVPAQIQKATGLDLQNDVLSWMHGESVIVVGPPAGGLLPDFALLIAPSDQAKAQAAVTKIQAALLQRLGIKLDQRNVSGGTMYVFPAAIPNLRGVQPAMALLEGRFILASSPDYVTALTKGGNFSSSDALKNTLGSSKDGTQFQLVLSLSGIRTYVETLLSGKNKAAYERDVKRYVDHLDAFGIRTTRDGNLYNLEMKVTVK
jgi:hypothetical protein